MTLAAYLRGVRPNPEAWNLLHRHAEGGPWTLVATAATQRTRRPPGAVPLSECRRECPGLEAGGEVPRSGNVLAFGWGLAFVAWAP